MNKYADLIRYNALQALHKYDIKHDIHFYGIHILKHIVLSDSLIIYHVIYFWNDYLHITYSY